MGYKLIDGTIDDACYKKLKPNEPFFLLEARNPLAPEIVHLWFVKAQQHGMAPEKLIEAIGFANAMVIWYNSHTAPVPTPDNFEWPKAERMPIFCLRGQDFLAEDVLRFLCKVMLKNENDPDYPPRKPSLIWEAQPQATTGDVWRIVCDMAIYSPRKFPD